MENDKKRKIDIKIEKDENGNLYDKINKYIKMKKMIESRNLKT